MILALAQVVGGGAGFRALAPGEGVVLGMDLRDMSVTPLLDRAEEVRLAREFQELRAEMADLAESTPARWRNALLGDEVDGPSLGWAWSIRSIDRMGVISAADPVKKTSSTVYSISRGMFISTM